MAARDRRGPATLDGTTEIAALPQRAVIEAYLWPLNGMAAQAWLTDVLERMVSGRTKVHELDRLLPWAWKAERLAAAAHA